MIVSIFYRLCVDTAAAKEKCETLARAAYSRDVRPEVTCVISGNCINSVCDFFIFSFPLTNQLFAILIRRWPATFPM